ncbi:MAG: hypothetical protein K0S53_1509 [Bacteroidetes bacterium]|jgi:hypothetical protein|nr:hypothetical protein [Bacteroidota bacterium]
MATKISGAAKKKKTEALLKKEISFLEKNMADYKAERKTSWKLFKSKMQGDIEKIKKSIDELTNPG